LEPPDKFRKMPSEPPMDLRKPPPARVSHKDEFIEVLRNLTHQLSQPLTSLHGSIELSLLGEGDDCESCKTLRQALVEMDRMSQVLGALREVIEAEGSGENS
jgi:signal transduction histidine kinase